MTHGFKTRFLSITTCILAFVFSTSVFANNGDNNTPYNLQWEDGANGIISFELQHEASYYSENLTGGAMPVFIFAAEVYRNGESIGVSSIAASDFTGRKVIMDVSKHMTEAGTYYFEASLRANSSTGILQGQVARSSEYVFVIDTPKEAPMTSTSNGDGYTPFNLQWLSNGQVSFEKQGGHKGYYRLELYRDGKSVQGMTVGNLDTVEVVDLSAHITETGTYYFTIFACQDPPSISIAGGETAKSEVYSYGKASESIGIPTNLRWETVGSEVYALWDAPSNRTEGDFYEVSVTGPTGYSLLFINITENKKLIDFDSFTSDYLGQPLENKGLYTFSVRAVSGNIDRIATSEIEIESPTAYHYPEGNIVSRETSATETPTVGTSTNNITAAPTSSTVLINGGNVAFDAYNIGGNNYFKLRDLAYALNGTEAQFEVGWDGEKNAINLTPGQFYSGANEMQGKGSEKKTAILTTSSIYVDGGEVSLTAYNIEGNNYFMLRELGNVLGFNVDWDGASNSILITTGG